MIEQPEGIVITISAGMYKDHGYKWWLANFLDAMGKNAAGEDWYYWCRTGSEPRREVQFVYLCIGGKIRFRCFYGGSKPRGTMTFGDRNVEGKAWIILAGPVCKPPRPMPRKGFQGFRYCEKLF